MWQRRGNYALLFVLTAAVMLSYMAFSIDGGRMRVAAVQVENAAEAASLAAIHTIREGGTRRDAEDRAKTAAEMVRVQRIGANDSTLDAYNLDIEWGAWNWDLTVEGPTLEGRWDLDSTRSQAVTVNASLTQDMPTIFAGAINLVGNGRGDGPSGTWDDGSGGGDVTRFSVRQGARAALKNRDIVVAVDVSRFSESIIDGVQTGLAAFAGSLDGNGVPGDRLAIVAYAGDEYVYPLNFPDLFVGSNSDVTIDAATNLPGVFPPVIGEPVPPFYDIEDNILDIQTTAGLIETCDISSEEFWRFYRHVESTDFDFELSDPAFGYTAFDPYTYFAIGVQGAGNNGGPSGGDGFRVNSPFISLELRDLLFQMLNAQLLGQEIDATFQNFTTPCREHAPSWTDFYECYWEERDGVMGEDVQCVTWVAIHDFYIAGDLRRQRAMNGNGIAARSPLPCHRGNYWETLPSSIDPINAGIPSLSCLTVNPPGTTVDRPDYAFSQAGSNPGQALQRAVTMFDNTVSNGERTVVLITPTAPRCGPSISNNTAIAGPCEDMMFAETAAALTALEDQEANVYVVGIVPAGSDDEAIMSLWDGIGRGYYTTVPNVGSLPAVLADIAADMKIQVVQ